MNLLHELPPGPNFQDHYDIPRHFSAEMGHFFEVAKELDGALAEVLGWGRATIAREQIANAADLYRTMLDEPRLES